MKSDNTKIKLRWELQQTGVEDAMDTAIKITSNRHLAINQMLWDGRSRLKNHVDALGPRMTEGARYDYPLNADSVVLDCGGYKGEWAEAIYRRYNCTVHVFEPIAAFYQRIAEKFRGVAKVHVHDYGVADFSGEMPFGIQNDSTGQFSQSAEREMVELRAVDRVIADLGLARIHLLKLNIEGAEFGVIETLLDTGLISQVDDLQVQFHECATDSRKRYEVIQERLPETHFLTLYTGWQWQSWRRTK